jgi:hypothetical protein
MRGIESLPTELMLMVVANLGVGDYYKVRGLNRYTHRLLPRRRFLTLTQYKEAYQKQLELQKLGIHGIFNEDTDGPILHMKPGYSPDDTCDKLTFLLWEVEVKESYLMILPSAPLTLKDICYFLEHIVEDHTDSAWDFGWQDRLLENQYQNIVLFLLEEALKHTEFKIEEYESVMCFGCGYGHFDLIRRFLGFKSMTFSGDPLEHACYYQDSRNGTTTDEVGIYVMLLLLSDPRFIVTVDVVHILIEQYQYEHIEKLFENGYILKGALQWDDLLEDVPDEFFRQDLEQLRKTYYPANE